MTLQLLSLQIMELIMSAKDELFRTFPVVVTQAVAWGDMDSFQHVNNVVYFRYFENSRIEYFRRIDWFHIEKSSGVAPILGSTQARFRRALTYPDTIHIGTRLHDMQADRFTIEHHIVSDEQDTIVTIGQGLVVAYDYQKSTKVPVPDELKARIRALEESINA
jgi:acyl-CoA thioester hydrolase